MAIDSRDKRFSMIGLATPWRPTFPDPNGAIDTSAERAQCIFLYSGIEASTAVAGASVYTIVIAIPGDIFDRGPIANAKLVFERSS